MSRPLSVGLNQGQLLIIHRLFIFIINYLHSVFDAVPAGARAAAHPPSTRPDTAPQTPTLHRLHHSDTCSASLFPPMLGDPSQPSEIFDSKGIKLITGFGCDLSRDWYERLSSYSRRLASIILLVPALQS